MMAAERRKDDKRIAQILERQDDHSRRLERYEQTLVWIQSAVEKTDQRTQGIFLQMEAFQKSLMSNGETKGLYEIVRGQGTAIRELEKERDEKPKGRQGVVIMIAVIISSLMSVLALILR